MSGDETDLLRQFAQTGDAEAFSEITRRYAGMVYGVCLRVTGDPERARDATQDTFLQLLKQAGQVADSLSGWLHRVATRRAVDLVRRDSARRQRERAFAADAVWETDVWADVSPLVDEAMNEIEPDQRELLLRHFLQGQTTVQMAAANGVSQPTMSRRVEGALEQLRERLRKKGVGVGAAVLGTMMAGAAQEAPAAVLSELGKMSLATPGTATATALSLKAKLAIAAAIALAGAGGYVSYKATRPAESAPPQMARGGAMMAGGIRSGRGAVAVGSGPAPMGGVAVAQGPGSGAVQGGGALQGGWVPYSVPLPGGGMAYGGMVVQTPQTRETTEGALALFARDLYATAHGRGSLAQLEECFAGTAEAEAFRRILENPETDAERELQQVLKSLGTVITVVQTTATEDGLKVKWKAAVQQPFTTTENGVAKTWRLGEGYELELRLRQVGGEWKIVGF